MKKVNRKELVKKFSLIFIFITFITVLAISKGETYLSYTDSTESPCEDYDYRQQNKAQCENWNGPTVVSNTFYDENGDINLIVVFLFWISLTSIMLFVVFQKLTSEHVLSGKCMAKKKSGEGYCSKNQLPGKLYCKLHLEENRFRIKKQN